MNSTVENIISKKDQFLSTFDRPSKFVDDVVGHMAGDAIESLRQLEFPTSRSEAWKYTRVNKIVNHDFKISKSKQEIDLKKYQIPGLDATEVVFVNGFYLDAISETLDGDDIVVLPMSEAREKYSEILNENYGQLADHKNEIFTAINTAFSENGLFIHVKKEVSKPIHFIHVIDEENCIAQTRNLIVAEEQSSANIIQSFISDSSETTFCNQVTEVVVKQNAKLSIDKIQNESNAAFHITNESVRQDRDSYFSINTFTLDGGWTRNNLNIFCKGKGTLTDLYGLYFPNGKQVIDNHTLVDHCEPDGESNELYKGIIYENAKGVFNGKVIVEPDAQRTNAYQQNANILMSDDANINSKPELEIYADDVKCSHGSTTGQFDQEAMFYLMARGIAKQNAKKLLTEAFLSEVVDHCKIDAVKELVMNNL